MTLRRMRFICLTDAGWRLILASAASSGKYLARSGNVKTLEGQPSDATLIALIAFPSAAAVRAFLADPDYAPYAAARQAGSDSRIQLIDDTDLAGTISYLPKAA